VSDYIDLGKRMRNLAAKSIDAAQDKKGKNEVAALKQEFEEILNSPAKSTSRDGGDRQYKDLLKGRFDVQVYRIEREADEKYDIYGKAFDFSAVTIAKLLQQGEREAVRHIEEGKIAW
jgi:hypothetical protein